MDGPPSIFDFEGTSDQDAFFGDENNNPIFGLPGGEDVLPSPLSTAKSAKKCQVRRHPARARRAGRASLERRPRDAAQALGCEARKCERNSYMCKTHAKTRVPFELRPGGRLFLACARCRKPNVEALSASSGGALCDGCKFSLSKARRKAQRRLASPRARARSPPAGIATPKKEGAPHRRPEFLADLHERVIRTNPELFERMVRRTLELGFKESFCELLHRHRTTAGGAKCDALLRELVRDASHASFFALEFGGRPTMNPASAKGVDYLIIHKMVRASSEGPRAAAL